MAKRNRSKKKTTKTHMTVEDKIRFLETSIQSLEGVRSKYIMNLYYGKEDIPQVEATIAELQEELKLLKDREKSIPSEERNLYIKV